VVAWGVPGVGSLVAPRSGSPGWPALGLVGGVVGRPWWVVALFWLSWLAGSRVGWSLWTFQGVGRPDRGAFMLARYNFDNHIHAQQKNRPCIGPVPGVEWLVCGRSGGRSIRKRIRAGRVSRSDPEESGLGILRNSTLPG